MFRFGYKFKLKEIKLNEIYKLKINSAEINIININFKFKKIFDKISNRSTVYIRNSFQTSLKLIKKK